MEKYGAITCPKCSSPQVEHVKDEDVVVKHAELIKTAAFNSGEGYLCRACGNRFTQITGSSSGSATKESGS